MRRSPYQSAAAVLTMFITLLLTGLFSLATISSVVILQYFESKPQLTVFFSDRAGQKEADALKQTLVATGKIADTKFVSKEEALALYKEQNKNDPLLLEMVTADILPASLEITTTRPEFMAELEPTIKKAEGVEEVVFQRDVVESLLKWTSGVRVFLGTLVALLGIDAIFIIMAITSMKIAVRREEIEILRLVGASRSYIRSPFLIEGGAYGLIGGFFSWLTITGVVLWYREVLVSIFGVVPVLQSVLAHPTDTLFIVLSLGFLGALTFAGFFVGALGSFVSDPNYSQSS